MLEWRQSFKMLIGHQIKYFFSVFRKAEVEFSGKVDRLAIISILFHPLMDSQLIVGVRSSLEKILYSTFERLWGLHLTMVTRGCLGPVIHYCHLQVSSLVFDEHSRVHRIKIWGSPHLFALFTNWICLIFPYISLAHSICIRISKE